MDNKINNTNQNNKKETEEKIKKMQTGLMDGEKCKEFAQKLVAYISGKN